MAGITVEELLATVLEDGEEVVKEAQVSRLESLKAELEAELAGKMENAKKMSAYEKQLRKEIAEEESRQHEEQLRKDAELQKQLSAKQQQEDERRKKETVEHLNSTVTNAIDKLYSSIGTSAKEYNQYIDRIQVRLLGANETFNSITNKLADVFGASPIFSMKS